MALIPASVQDESAVYCADMLSTGFMGAENAAIPIGGTVAVFGNLDALKKHIPEIAVEYQRRVGVMPDIFEGTSPGAIEFGAKRYAFGSNGWNRFDV